MRLILLASLLLQAGTGAVSEEEPVVLKACWGTAPQTLDPAKIVSLRDARYLGPIIQHDRLSSRPPRKSILWNLTAGKPVVFAESQEGVVPTCQVKAARDRDVRGLAEDRVGIDQNARRNVTHPVFERHPIGYV